MVECATSVCHGSYLTDSMTESEDNIPDPFSRVIIALMKGVVYEENDPALWQDLFALQARARDYISVLGLELILDEAEGYAWLRTRPVVEGAPELPRLIPRRQLSFPVSLLLALLHLLLFPPVPRLGVDVLPEEGGIAEEDLRAPFPFEAPFELGE